ncbi:MAG: glycosyltransferase [Flavobacteriales bacterium]|nr:glycosyltransferase [Flavobacteriales bacterium]
MSDQPLVSVLMPAYNAEKFVAEAVKSILNQDHENWELLILDDASTDSTLAIANSINDERIKVFRNDENRGYLLSCNELFEKASGDFITFLDADDTCAANRLSVCVQEFINQPDLDFLTTDHTRINDSGNQLSERLVSVDYDRYASEPSYYPTICCAAIFLRKELLQKVGGYHPFFKEIGGEDYHWLFQLSRNGKGTHVKRSLYFYRTHRHQTHLKNTNPLKYFAKDIDQEIRSSVLMGDDVLENDEKLGIKWNEFVSKHPSELYLRKASEALNLNQNSDFLQALAKAVFSWPPSFKIIKKASYLAYSKLARIT